jgi:hypothetical protein
VPSTPVIPLRILKKPPKTGKYAQKYIKNGTKREVNQNPPLKIILLASIGS